MRHTAYLIAVYLLLPSFSWAASFDCNRATTLVEKLVCADPGLSQTDEKFSKTYNEILQSLRDSIDLKQDQIKWLREVRNKCADIPCLNKVYRDRLAVLEQVSSRTKALEIPAAATSTGPAPLRVIDKITNFSPTDYPIIARDDRLIFSQFDHSGNDFDVVAFDMADQTSAYIVRGLRGGQFVAQNDKYLVVSGKDSIVRPLIVKDRATGKTIKQIKLQRPITWAKIEGNRLIAVQGAFMFNVGYTAKAEALIFELPSLKVLKSVEIIGGNDVQPWQGKILSLGYDLAAYDNEFNELFKISLPARKQGNGVSCAATWPLGVYKDKAVVIANCGDILVFDLSTHQLVQTIPSYSHFYAVAILDGLIFTTPTSEPRQRDNAHVYDLSTGKELAVLPINATDLFVKGNRILAIEREFAKPSLMTLYSVDVSAIRSGNWREDRILSECLKAQLLLTDSRDLYAAIDMCKATGIEGLVGGAEIPKAILPVAKRYALWLSQTLDRGRDAIPILEILRRIAPDEDIERTLANIKLKTAILSGSKLGPLTKEEQETPFSRILKRGDQFTHVETKNVNFGSFPNLFLFSGDRIYVGRYSNGTSIGVLDRRTLDEIADIPIAPDDNTYQDNVFSIASDKKHIYAVVAYRYEQAGRPNFFVIDKESFKTLKSTQLQLLSTLITDGDMLLSCGCHFTTDQRCKLVDPIALKTEDIPGKVCIQNEFGSESVVSFSGANTLGSRYVANTNDYLVAKASGPRDAPYLFYPKTGGAPKTVQFGATDSLSWPVAVEGNSIIVKVAMRNGALIKQVNATTGTALTLLGVPTTSQRYPVVALYKQTLFIGFGRDLIVFDLTSNQIHRYIKDYIVSSQGPSSNIDANQIVRLIVDRDRLIALTFRGENSRVVRLEDLMMDGR